MNAVDEMRAHPVQWFALLEMWNTALPIVIGILEIPEAVIVRRAIHPDIIDQEFAARFEIVINDHLAGSDKGDLADFPGFQPTALDTGKTPAGEDK